MIIPNIKALSENISVWLIYSGRRRLYLDLFKKNNVVFLNLPGFDAKPNTFNSNADITQHLMMSGAVRRSLYKTGSTDLPSRDVATYPKKIELTNAKEAKSFSREIGSIKRLFSEVKKGDIIISPGKSPFDPLLIGEVTEEWRKEDDFRVVSLNDELVPARKVKWFDLFLTRQDFSLPLARHLTNRQAITKIDNVFYNEILDNIYPCYTWGSRSKIDIFADNYQGKDPLQPYYSANLLKYLMSAAFAYEKNEYADFAQLSEYDAIKKYYDPKSVIDFKQNFNSPGKFTIVLSSALAAVLISSGLVMAHELGGGADLTKSVAQALLIPTHIQGTTTINHLGVANSNFINAMRGPVSTKIMTEAGRASNDSMPLSFDSKAQINNRKKQLLSSK